MENMRGTRFKNMGEKNIYILQILVGKINSGAVNKNWILKTVFHLIRCKISIEIKIRKSSARFSLTRLFEY